MSKKKYYLVELKSAYTGKWITFDVDTDKGVRPKYLKNRKEAEEFMKSRKILNPLRIVKWKKKVCI